jgi:hypothetical protein
MAEIKDVLNPELLSQASDNIGDVHYGEKESRAQGGQSRKITPLRYTCPQR